MPTVPADISAVNSAPVPLLEPTNTTAGEATLLSLANETLTIIAANLNIQWTTSALTNFMLTCTRTAGVAEQIRYTNLIISGGQGRRILATLLSGSNTAKRYCTLVNRIWYRGWADTEMHLNASLLAETLPALLNLTALWLDANPLDAIHLMARMKKHGIIRESRHPAFNIADMAKLAPSSPLTVPRLEYLRLTGDPDMGRIAWNRRLVSLDMSHVLDHDEFANFLWGAENTNLGDALQTLSLKLGNAIEISIAFPLIGNTFPNLINLSLEQNYLIMKDVLSYMATPLCTLPILQSLALNRVFSYQLPRWGAIFPFEEMAATRMDRLLRNIANTHAFLNLVGVGSVLYELEITGTFARRTGRLQIADRWSALFGPQLEIERFIAPLPSTSVPEDPEFVEI